MSCRPVEIDNCCSPLETCSCRPICNPLCDGLSPFPDEIIMTVLDRILYYSGATQIFHQLAIASISKRLIPPLPAATPAGAVTPKPTCTFTNSAGPTRCSSNSSFSKYASARSTAKCKSVSSCSSPPKASSLKSKCTVGRCGSSVCCPRPRTPRVDFSHPASNCRQTAGGQSVSDRMTQSISACSIAYRRLKAKLATKMRGSNQKWLWTRLVRVEDGCHVYEVYKNSDLERAPSKMAGAKEPVILFLVMPNGRVMPFESLSTF